MLALVVALAAAGVIVIVSQPAASRLSSDFTINYSAGLLIRDGYLTAPYQQAELGDVMRRVAPDGAIDPRLPFSLPLAAGLPYAALSLLPLDAASVGAGLLLLSPLAGGVGGLSAMVHNALTANQAVLVRLNESWIGLFGPALPAAAATWLAIALYLGVLVGLVLLAWRRPPAVVAFAALARAMTALASPHALPHDLLILAVPAWLAMVLYRDGALPTIVPGLLLIELALLFDLHGFDLPVGPIAMTLV